MADIIPFPTKSVRDWVVLEKTFRDALANNGVTDPAAIAHIVGRMRPFVDLCNRDFSDSVPLTLPGNTTIEQHAALRSALEDAFGRFEKSRQQLTNELLLDRLIVETTLYFAQQRAQ